MLAGIESKSGKGRWETRGASSLIRTATRWCDEQGFGWCSCSVLLLYVFFCPFCLHLFQCLQLHSLVSDDAISNRKQMRSVKEDSNFLEGLQCQAQQIGLGFKLTNYDLVLWPFFLQLFHCLQRHSLVFDDAISSSKHMRFTKESSNKFLEDLLNLLELSWRAKHSELV